VDVAVDNNEYLVFIADTYSDEENIMIVDTVDVATDVRLDNSVNDI